MMTPEEAARHRTYTKRYQLNVRKKVFDHYGNKCECCGEDRWEFLAIDHKNGDGAKHRAENHIHSGFATYLWIIRNNYPDMFRVLCHNCNSAIGFYGYCPHQKKEGEFQ